MSHERLTISRYDDPDQQEQKEVDESSTRAPGPREDRWRGPFQRYAGRDRGSHHRSVVRRAPTEDGSELMFSFALQASPATRGVSCYFTSFCLI